jgi:hypothetical protein
MNCLLGRAGLKVSASFFFVAAVLAAVVLSIGHLTGSLNPVHLSAALFAFLMGIPVVTYNFEAQPGQSAVSSTTPPTALQASRITTIVATVFLDTSDTTVSVVHNWGLPQLDQQLLFPLVWFYPTALAGQGTAVTNPGIEIDLPAASTTPANSITVNKSGTGASTGGTYNVVLLRPHTIMGGV